MYPRTGRLVRRHPAAETPEQQHDRELAALLRCLPNRGAFEGPRQDSLHAQLKDLWAIANRLGCYDAADFIDRTIRATGTPAPVCLGGDQCHGFDHPAEHVPACPLHVKT